MRRTDVLKKQVIRSPMVADPGGPFSQAVSVEAVRLTWVSGQVGLAPGDGGVVHGDMATQTRQVMENVKALLLAAGLTFDHVVKTTVFLVDLADLPIVNAEYGKFFGERQPARSTVAVAALPREGRIEVECVAAS